MADHVGDLREAASLLRAYAADTVGMDRDDPDNQAIEALADRIEAMADTKDTVDATLARGGSIRDVVEALRPAEPAERDYDEDYEADRAADRYERGMLREF